MITQKELKEILHYDPETGYFIWLKLIGKRAVIGSRAGSKCIDGYIYIHIEKKKYRAHRLAWFYMTGKWPKETDHINHVRHDNRFCNIRDVTCSQNMKNRPLKKNNKSGFTGVCWHKRDEVWRIQIKPENEKIKTLGFKDKFEAICARISANNKYNFHPNHGK
ncbi:MAG: HNH endonuclease [Deltaproteobacteria bacterium]|nr:HNH endonuclease [Deltaproteobacteria bacterium]